MSFLPNDRGVPELAHYLSYGTIRNIKKKTIIDFSKDNDFMRYVVSGSLRVYIINGDNKRQYAYTATEGHIIGIGGADEDMLPVDELMDRKPIDGLKWEDNYSLEVIAEKDTVVCMFTKDQLFAMIKDNPGLFVPILTSYRDKAGYFLKRGFKINHYSSSVRVIMFIVELCDTKSEKVDNDYKITINISQKDIAEITGVHFVSVSRIIKGLSQNGILTKNKDEFVVHDYEQLQRIIKDESLLRIWNL